LTKALVLDDNRSVMDKLEEFLRVVDSKIGLEQVLLFGSTAKQKRRKDSDVDLIVVSKSFSGLNSLERGKMLLEDWPFVEELDLLMYTPEEFERVSKRPLVKEMITDALDLTPKKRFS
jgi:predicted nucleotidyltransferase